MPLDIDPVLARHFGVFRRERRHTDVVPEHIAEFVGAMTDAAWALDVDQSRACTPPETDSKIYLVPGRGVVGIYGGGGGSVTSADRAALGDVATSFTGRGTLLVSGLLPDDATAPALRLRDGTTTPLLVNDNVFAMTVKATAPSELADAVLFLRDGEPVTLAVPGSDEEILSLRAPHETAT